MAAPEARVDPALNRTRQFPRQERHLQKGSRLGYRGQAEELWGLTEVCKVQPAMMPKGKEPTKGLSLFLAPPHQNWDPMDQPSNQKSYDQVNCYG